MSGWGDAGAKRPHALRAGIGLFLGLLVLYNAFLVVHRVVLHLHNGQPLATWAVVLFGLFALTDGLLSAYLLRAPRRQGTERSSGTAPHDRSTR